MRTMDLASYYRSDKFGLSFELFPPKTHAGEEALLRHTQQLMGFRPDFLTCTYGAGGSTREKTLSIVDRVRRTHAIPVASHVTCVGATVEQLRDYLSEAQRLGIEHVVALRGDPPQGEREFRPAPGGLRYASELVALIRAEFPEFGVAVGGYPETHREATSPAADIEHLRRKVDAGADILITQLFYQNSDYFRFRDRCERAGIAVPIVPGILPVTSLTQIRRITSLCGANLPEPLLQELGKSDEPDWQFHAGIEFAVQQVQQLIQCHVPGIHFYVLNKSQAAATVLKSVGRPA